MNILLFPFIKVKSQIDQLQKDSLAKSNERILFPGFAILAHKLQRLIVDGLGQDQQQHPAAHTGGVSKGRVCSCGCWHC